MTALNTRERLTLGAQKRTEDVLRVAGYRAAGFVSAADELMVPITYLPRTC